MLSCVNADAEHNDPVERPRDRGMPAASDPDAPTLDTSSSDAQTWGAQTLDEFLAGIGARAFRFAEIGLRHREDALDAVQDAMTATLHYRERPEAEWTPLFWRILRSRISDIRRRRLFRDSWLMQVFAGGNDDRSDDSIDWADTAADPTADPTRANEGREAYRQLVLALRDLPPRQREAFSLRVLEELDGATSARAMGCSEGSVKTHLARARTTLQRQLRDFT